MLKSIYNLFPFTLPPIHIKNNPFLFSSSKGNQQQKLPCLLLIWTNITIVRKMEQGGVAYENDLNLKATELRLGLPGTEEQAASGVRSNKRPLNEAREDGLPKEGQPEAQHGDQDTAPAPKAQIVGWPPIRSYRKNNLQPKKAEATEASAMYVKVSMDGAPFLRKIDLKGYEGYPELLKALETMFKLTIGEYSEREGYKGSEYAPAYEDKDGDLMLVGDVPWDMFMSSCKRLRIMKGLEARGLGCGV